MGNSVIDSSSNTYVRLPSGSFIKKDTGSLNIGEHILFQKPFATTTIDEVDPYLDGSPRYLKSKEFLHDQNYRGDFVPKLRTYLIKGLADKGIIASNNIDQRIYSDSGNEFSRHEYERMVNHIQEILKSHGKSRSNQSIENWLKGEVIAPNDWKIFDALKDVNSGFGQFVEYSQDSKSMYFNYRLYVVIRQGIMRYLNECRGIHEEPYEEGVKRISLFPEYQIIFDHFMKNLNESLAVARITRIERLNNERKVKYIQDTNGFLSDGILTDEFDFAEKNLSTYLDLLRDTEILQFYTFASCEDFEFPIKNPYKGMISIRAAKNSFAEYVISALEEYFGEEPDLEMLLYKSILDSKPSENRMFISHVTNALRDAILEGDMDQFFKFDRGTEMKLFEYHHSLRRSLPKDYIKWRVLTMETERAKTNPESNPEHFQNVNNKKAKKMMKKMKSEKRQEMDDIVERLKKKYSIVASPTADYNLPNKRFFTDTLQNKLIQFGWKEKSMSIREYFEKEFKRDPKSAKDIYSHLKDHGYEFLCRDEVYEILKKFRLEKIIDLRWQDFILEKT